MADMFGTTNTVIAGRARIGDATIKYESSVPSIDGDAADELNEVPAMNLQIQYQEQVTPQPLPGGEVFLKADQGVGKITIGAILHADFIRLMSYFGDMDQMVASPDPDATPPATPEINKLTIHADSGITVEEGSTSDYWNDTTDETGLVTDPTIVAEGVKITDFGMQLSIEEMLLQTNVEIYALNIEKPS